MRFDVLEDPDAYLQQEEMDRWNKAVERKKFELQDAERRIEEIKSSLNKLMEEKPDEAKKNP